MMAPALLVDCVMFLVNVCIPVGDVYLSEPLHKALYPANPLLTLDFGKIMIFGNLKQAAVLKVLGMLKLANCPEAKP